MDETLAAAAAPEQAAPEREPETLEEVMSRHSQVTVERGTLSSKLNFMEMEMTPELMYGQSVYADVESPMGTNHQNSLGYEAQDGYYPGFSTEGTKCVYYATPDNGSIHPSYSPCPIDPSFIVDGPFLPQEYDADADPTCQIIPSPYYIPAVLPYAQDCDLGNTATPLHPSSVAYIPSMPVYAATSPNHACASEAFLGTSRCCNASTDMIGRPMPAVKHSTMAKLSGNNCFARVGSDPQKWAASEKFQPTSKSSGHLNADGISNAEKHSAQRSPAIAAKSYTSKLAVGNSDGTILIRPDQYNGNDLRVDYAKFFVIKSIVKADVHKSIKYGVWSSSSSGNRKLDCAFRDANKIARMDNTKCPVFLFFSVNGSGHFCGMAEMVGPVDFHKDMDFWFQDKWTGCFPVRWHITKDVPNCTLQHILLQNNENNPVTHSRDIQEIPYVPGVSMVMIMKDIKVKECLFDDFMRHEEVEAKLGSVRIGRTSEIQNVSDEPHDCIVNKHQDPCVEGHCKVKQQHIEKVRSLVIQANKRFSQNKSGSNFNLEDKFGWEVSGTWSSVNTSSNLQLHPRATNASLVCLNHLHSWHFRPPALLFVIFLSLLI